MHNHHKNADGLYHIGGSTFSILAGSRAQVWHGTAHHTSGGLTKADLMQNNMGRIVSRAKHFSAKKEMRLLKHGYGTQKGKFGVVKLNGAKSARYRRSRGTRKSRSRRRR